MQRVLDDLGLLVLGALVFEVGCLLGDQGKQALRQLHSAFVDLSDEGVLQQLLAAIALLRVFLQRLRHEVLHWLVQQCPQQVPLLPQVHHPNDVLESASTHF